MVAKAWNSEQRAVDEIFFQNDAVSLCLLINRRARTMRIIDFRAGPSLAKRSFVMSLSQRESVEKVYTLVERDEVATWVKLGFDKEGNIPGFYKRSDAFLLGCSVESERASIPPESGIGISLANRHPEVAADGYAHTDGYVDAAADVHADAKQDPAHALMERTVVAGKKYAKELAEKSLPTAKLSPLKEVDARKAVQAAIRGGRAITGFEPFGRDVDRKYYLAALRSGFECVASIESQSCFGNTLLELLTSPKNDTERTQFAAVLQALCDKMLETGVVSCFSLAPNDDVGLATAFAANGFRRTGLLKNHLVVAGQRKDAIIWSRKVGNPADE